MVGKNEAAPPLAFTSEFHGDASKKNNGAPLNGLSLATFAKQFGSASGDKWDFHNEHEKAVVDRCYAELLPRWKDRLADTSTYLRDNCWVMMESAIVTLPLQSTATDH